MTAVTNARGFTTTFAYDGGNRLTASTDQLGHTTTTVYDRASNATELIDPLGHRTTFSYDGLNRQVAMTRASGGVWTTIYDQAGHRQPGRLVRKQRQTGRPKVEAARHRRPVRASAARPPGGPGPRRRFGRPMRGSEADAEVVWAQDGLRKLAEGQDDQVTPQELRGLEAIILPGLRPVAFVRNNAFERVGDPLGPANYGLR